VHDVFSTGGAWNCGHQWILDTTAVVHERLVSIGDVLSPTGIDIGKAVRVATSAIDKVHVVPELVAKVPVVGSSTMTEGATYTWFPVTNQPRDIKINTKGDHQAASALQEFGHLIDHQLIGEPGVFASIDHPGLADWRKNVDNSRWFKGWKMFRERGRFLLT
jgi:hypothetical protein